MSEKQEQEKPECPVISVCDLCKEEDNCHKSEERVRHCWKVAGDIKANGGLIQ